MARRFRSFVRGATIFFCALFVGAGVATYLTGFLRISIHEKKTDGTNLNLIMPAAVVPLGLALVPANHLRDAGREVRPWLPAIEIAAEELARCPDGAFLEVRNLREHVTISKHSGLLVVHVDDHNATIHVSFPLKMAAFTARSVAARGIGNPQTPQREPPPGNAPGA